MLFSVVYKDSLLQLTTLSLFASIHSIEENHLILFFGGQAIKKCLCYQFMCILAAFASLTELFEYNRKVKLPNPWFLSLLD